MVDGECRHENKRHLLLGRKAMINLDSILKSRHYFSKKDPTKFDYTWPTKYSQSYGFSSSHVWIWELDDKEGLESKNWCFWTVVLEKTLESPLDSKQVNAKGNQPWIFIGRTDAETEAPILWPPDVKRWLVRKDPDPGKYWRQERGTAEDEIVGWHHWHIGHEFEQALGDSEGQGSLACCSSWDHKESDMTEWLNNNNSYWDSKNSPNVV